MQRITILGSTGSVGQSTLAVLALHPEKFVVDGLSAATNVEQMLIQCEQYKPRAVVMVDSAAADQLAQRLAKIGLEFIQVDAGAQALSKLAHASTSDSIMSAIVGAAGLLPTLQAVQAGKRVLIANKEPLVMTGDLFIQEARQSGATVLPIDSEHNAIFQCLPADQSTLDVSKIHLTASGGPFLGAAWEELKDVTPDQACAHPNWSMGRKISVDSATLMNKGLELIEAAALFGLSADLVEIVIHPQSIIHSMVEYTDGSFLAQLGAPDMKIPIAHALSWPQRISSGANTLDITEVAKLEFHKPDMQQLPCLRLARQAALAGGTAPAILNAANEVAVDAFLQERLGFTQIPIVIEQVLQSMAAETLIDIEHVLQIDHKARELAKRALKSYT